MCASIEKIILAEPVKEYFRQGGTCAGAMGVNRKVGNWQGEGGKEHNFEDHVAL